MSRTWTIDQRLQALGLHFTADERDLARRIAEALRFALFQRELPEHCHEDEGEVLALDFGIVKVKRIRDEKDRGQHTTSLETAQ